MRYVIPVCAMLLFCRPLLAAPETSGIDKAMQEGRISQAARMWEELAAKNPRRIEIQVGYAQFLQGMGQLDPAMKTYERCLSLNPKAAAAYAGLSEISLQILDIPSALAYAQKALAVDPTSKDARIVYVTALLQSGRNTEADQESEKLLSAQPHDARVLHLAYEVKSHKGDLVGARHYLQEAVKLNSDRIDWTMDLCTLLESAGDYREARAYLQEAVAHHPDSIEARLHMARHMELFDKDYDQAIDQYQAALKIDHSSGPALAGIDRCQAKKNDLARSLKLALQQLFAKH